ncbi:uncharacterized protein LOC111088429 isoform X2 [Limulus polyphemus]|uniref:Uncharacterized protein LOC111088429 isoform X2 n=1 Tax=Limulus polyphemus TaxID=6850 RepID=A0ABM1TEE6_LIMPO|nr:uncharacterized protein LOC111088429 isoform X2 [Limulus polyphemus]
MGNEASQEQGTDQVDQVPSGQAFPGRPQEQTRVGTGFVPMGGPPPSQDSQQPQPPLSRPRTLETMSHQPKMAAKFQVMTPAAPEVDLSDLSEAERAQILSVMAQAEHMDKDLEKHRKKVQHTRQETTPGTTSAPPPVQTQQQQLCPQCHVTVLTAETMSQCTDCKIAACRKCGTSLAEADGRAVWVCVECIRRRSQISSSQSRKPDYRGDQESSYQNLHLAPSGSRKSQHGYRHEISTLSTSSSAQSAEMQQDEQHQVSKTCVDQMGQTQHSDSRKSVQPLESKMQRYDSLGSMSQDTKNCRTIRKQLSQEYVEQSSLPISTAGQSTHQEKSLQSMSQIRTQQPSLPWAPVSPALQPNNQDKSQQPSLLSTSDSVTVMSINQVKAHQSQVSSQKDVSGYPSEYSDLVDVKSIPISNMHTINYDNGQVTRTESDEKHLSSASYFSSSQNVSQQQKEQQQRQQLTTYEPSKPKTIDLQSQKKQKQRSDSQEWSPVIDLSPIVDVSPSVEAAEQELMGTFQDINEYEELIPQMSMPRVTSGTIPEMLANYQKSLEQTLEETQQTLSSEGAQLEKTFPEAVRADKEISLTSINQATVSRITEKTRPIPKEQSAPISIAQIVTTQSQSPKAASSRRIHRRLPQPTLEQMQEAIALAAQTPKFKSPQHRGQTTSIYDSQPPKEQGSSGEVPAGRNVSPVISKKGLTEKIQSHQQQHKPLLQSEFEQRNQMIKVAAGDTKKVVLRAATSTINATATTQPFAIQPTAVTRSLMVSEAGTPLQSSAILSYGSSTQAAPSVSSQFGMMYSNSQTLMMRSPFLDSRKYVPELKQEMFAARGTQNINFGYIRSSSVPDSVSKIGTYTQAQRDKAGDSSDTQSETGSSTSAKLRRQLPHPPPNQEVSSIANIRRRKDRRRNLSVGSSPLMIQERHQLKKLPDRASSLEESIPKTLDYNITRTDPLAYLPTHTEAYINQLSDSVSGFYLPKTTDAYFPCSTMTTEAPKDSSATKAATQQLIQPSDLNVSRASIPSYMYSLKQQLREELKTVTQERIRLAGLKEKGQELGLRHKSETDIASLLLTSSSLGDLYGNKRIRSGAVRTISTSAQTSPQDKEKVVFLQNPSECNVEMKDMFNTKEYLDSSANLSPYTSFRDETPVLVHSRTFESSRGRDLPDDGSGPSWYTETLDRGLVSHYHQRRMYPQDSPIEEIQDIPSFRLREIVYSDNIKDQRALFGSYKRGRITGRHTRYSTGLGESFSDAGADWDSQELMRGYQYFLDERRRRREPTIRKPRSWHPSPYGSEDEDDLLTRDEIIKIKGHTGKGDSYTEDTGRLRKELRKLARKRESYEKFGYRGEVGTRDYYTTSYQGEILMSPRRRLRDAQGNLGFPPSSTFHSYDMLYRGGPSSWTKYDMGSSKPQTSGGYSHVAVPASYSTPSLSRHGYVRKPEVLWYGSEPTSPSARFPENTEEDNSIARIALTFPANGNTTSRIHRHNRLPIDSFLDFSPATPDSETPPEVPEFTPAMPILPDMPSRSRKLLEDLGSAPIVGPRSHQSQREFSHPDRPRGHHREGMTRGEYRESKVQERSSPRRRNQYDFPVKRILLTRDPKDRFVKGNGFGLEIIGGKEIPDNNGMTGAYIAKIYPSVMVDTLGEVAEGDQVLEWNGITLNGKTFEEVKRIIASSEDEVEMVIRSDLNVLKPQGVSHVQRHTPNRGYRPFDDSGPGQGHNPRGSSGRPRDFGRLSPERSYYSGNNGTRSVWRRNHPENLTSSQLHNQNPRTNSLDRLGSPGGYPVDISHMDNHVDVPRAFDEGAIQSHARHESGTLNHNHHPILPLSTSTYQGSLQDMPGSRAAGHKLPSNSPTDDEQYKLQAPHIAGEIKIQVCFDSKASILYVTIVKARNLGTSRDNSGFPDPFVKCYLLPGRRIENQRRTRYFSRCSNPEWNQTMVYPNITRELLQEKFLEISVWNYDIHKPSEFLGEVIVDLADESMIDEQARWCKLQNHDKSRYPRDPSGKTRSSLENDGSGQKMARLQNVSGEVKFHPDHEKKFHKHYHRKSVASTDSTKESSMKSESVVFNWQHQCTSNMG